MGAAFLAAAAILHAARHPGAMAFVATRAGGPGEHHRLVLQAGGAELLTLSVVAALVGLAYLLWGEYESRIPRR